MAEQEALHSVHQEEDHPAEDDHTAVVEAARRTHVKVGGLHEEKEEVDGDSRLAGEGDIVDDHSLGEVEAVHMEADTGRPAEGTQQESAESAADNSRLAGEQGIAGDHSLGKVEAVLQEAAHMEVGSRLGEDKVVGRTLGGVVVLWRH